MAQIEWAKLKEMGRVMKSDKVAIKIKTEGKNVDIRVHVGGAPDFPQHTASGVTFDAAKIDEMVAALQKCKDVKEGEAQ
jgi:hypothetical protein